MLTVSPCGEVELPSYDELVKFARDDPDAYETWRREMIERFINRAPNNMKPRLRGIQFRVDSLRRISHSGLGATIKISNLMWQSFQSLNDQWHELAVLNDNLRAGNTAIATADATVRQDAQVFPFQPRRRASAG